MVLGRVDTDDDYNAVGIGRVKQNKLVGTLDEGKLLKSNFEDCF